MWYIQNAEIKNNNNGEDLSVFSILQIVVFLSFFLVLFCLFDCFFVVFFCSVYLHPVLLNHSKKIQFASSK